MTAQGLIARVVEESIFGLSSRDSRLVAQRLAESILDELAARGFRIVGPDGTDPATVKRCAQVVREKLIYADTTSPADKEIVEAVLALAKDEAASAARMRNRNEIH